MKQDNPQFPKLKSIDTGDSVPPITLGEAKVGSTKAEMSDKPASFVGSAGSRMKAVASFGKEDETAVAKVGENKPVRVSTKSGRRKVAGQLGLPNVKKSKRG